MIWIITGDNIDGRVYFGAGFWSGDKDEARRYNNKEVCREVCAKLRNKFGATVRNIDIIELNG